jgi:hypothetical protein
MGYGSSACPSRINSSHVARDEVTNMKNGPSVEDIAAELVPISPIKLQHKLFTAKLVLR